MIPDWHITWFDETRYFNISDEDEQYIEKIIGVYFFDKSEHIYCCESTPSHFMMGLYHTIHFVDGTPDDTKDRLSQEYETYPVDDFYIHVNQTKNLECVPYGKMDDDTTEDDVREYWQGNHVF